MHLATRFSRQVGLCIHLSSKQEVSQHLNSIHLQLPKVVASPHSRFKPVEVEETATVRKKRNISQAGYDAPPQPFPPMKMSPPQVSNLG